MKQNRSEMDPANDCAQRMSRKRPWRRRCTALVPVLVMGVSLSACGEPGDNGEETERGTLSGPDFCRRFWELTCRVASTCCPAAGVTVDSVTCVEVSTADCIVDLEPTAYQSYDSAAAERCLAARQASYDGCSFNPATAQDAEACRVVLRGTSAVGGPCLSSNDCAPVESGRLACSSATSDEPGECVAAPLARAGESCRSVQCGPASFCSDQSVCEATRSTGQACANDDQCLSELCSNGVCAPASIGVEDCMELVEDF